MWEVMKDKLLQDNRQEFSALVGEGKTVAKASLQAALDTAYSAARSVAMAVTICRNSWLQVSGVPQEVQQTLQDLPFEGSSPFSEQTDIRLDSLKDLG